MSDRKVEFIVSAKDDFSATFGRASKDIADLRRQLSLPLTGPLTKAEQQFENRAVSHIRAMEGEGIRNRQDSILNRAIYGPERPASKPRAANDIYRLDPVTGGGPGDHRNSYQYDITRLRGGMEPREGEKAKAKAEESFLAAMGKAAAGLYLFAKTVERVHDTIEGIREGKKWGETTGQSFRRVLEIIPGIKEFGELRDIHHGDVKREEIEADRQQRREQAQQMKDAKKAQMDAIMLPARDAAIAAQDTLALAGLSGNKRENAAARIEYNRRIRELDKQFDENKGKFNNPDQLDEFKKNINTSKAAAAAELNDKLAEMDRARMHQLEEDSRQVVRWNAEADDLVKQNHAKANNDQLEEEGSFLTAKINAIKAATDQQIRELDRQKDEEIRALEADPTIGKDASVIKDNALARFAAKKAAIINANNTEINKLNTFDQRDSENAERDHQQRLIEIKSDFAARGLRLTGKYLDADKLVIQSQLESRLQAIAAAADKEVEAHKEREDDIRRQAEEDARAAVTNAELSTREVIQQRANLYRLPGLASISPGSRLLLGIGGATERASVGGFSAADPAKVALEHKQADDKNNAKIIELLTKIAGKAGADVIPAPSF